MNISNYIASKSQSVNKKNINGTLELLLINYEKYEKKNKYNQLKTKYAGFPVMEHVLYQNFLYYIHEAKEMKEAEKLLKQLEKEFPDSKMLPMAQLDLSISNNEYTYSPEGNYQSELSDEETESLGKAELVGNYPNPFNPTTTIKYQLPVAGFVTIKVYDILGKEISTLVKEHKSAGIHSVEFDASSGGGLPSGVYIYTVSANGLVQSKKMILTK